MSIPREEVARDIRILENTIVALSNAIEVFNKHLLDSGQTVAETMLQADKEGYHALCSDCPRFLQTYVSCIQSKEKKLR